MPTYFLHGAYFMHAARGPHAKWLPQGVNFGFTPNEGATIIAALVLLVLAGVLAATLRPSRAQ